MNLAIDSLPLNRDIYKAYDYSALQILSLRFFPLYKDIYKIKRKNNKFHIYLKANHAEDYVASIKQLVNRNFFIKKIILRNVTDIMAKNNEIILSYKNYFDVRNLFIPNIARQDNIKINNLYLVKSPHENHQMFDRNKIDFLCDTAVDLDKLNHSFRQNWNGLIACLNYSTFLVQRADFKQLKIIFESYRPNERSKVLNPIYRIQKYEIIKKKFPKIVIAYDPFYPNEELMKDFSIISPNLASNASSKKMIIIGLISVTI